jgi:hypothetical protein
LDFGYIVEEIQQDIEMFSKIGKKYTFIIQKRPITIYIIYPSETQIVTTKQKERIYRELDTCAKKMYLWLFVIMTFSPTECSRQLIIYLYLTDHKKVLPEIDEKFTREDIGSPIDREHANTAFTRACPIDINQIYIYRKEEWFKVFIHETFHSFGLDFSTLSDKYATDAMFSIFPVKCELRFYEAYTETWAEILNVLFVVIETIGISSNSQIYKYMEGCLKEEIMFSLFQSVKILDHQQMKYRELWKKSKYRENTQAFSYYILRSIFMFSVNDFIEWCAIKNKGTIAFKKTPNNIVALVHFIGTKYREPDYVKIIEEIERWFSKYRLSEGFEMETLRMTVYG